MLACIVNALMFTSLLGWYYKKYKRVDYVFVVLALYSVVATSGIGYYVEFYDKPIPVTIIPFIYLFISSLILFKPLIKEGHRDFDVTYIKDSSFFEKLVTLFVICSIISLYNIWTNVITNIMSGDWQFVKSEAYSGEVVKSGTVVSYLGAFAQYFRYVIYPYCFYCFCKIEKSFLKACFILILSITVSLFQYLLIAYRGGIFSILIMLLISFLMFFSYIPPKRKKILFMGGGVIVFVLLSITVSITNSRFENSEISPFESLFSYFGQSMVNFNGGIANSVQNYMGGKFFFMSVLGLKKSDFWIDYKYGIFTNNGSDFNTLVGCFYIDFGPILAFFIFFVISWIMSKLLKKKKYSWSTLYILMFYLDTLVCGVFHGQSYFSQFVSNAIVIYLIISVIEKYGCKNFGMLSYK